MILTMFKTRRGSLQKSIIAVNITVGVTEILSQIHIKYMYSLHKVNYQIPIINLNF
jgi:hypothetical protein